MADQFAVWTQLLALAQEHKTKSSLRDAITKAGIQIIETEPHSGYYRSAAVKDGPLLPVAIWREGATLHVWRGGEPVNLERVWPYCVWNPISYEWYEAKTERGEPWPDEHVNAAAIPASITDPEGEAAKNVEARERLIALGHNEPPEESETDALARQIEAAAANASQYEKIASDEQAGAAQSLRARLNELSGDADKKRVAEKAPHLDKCKEIDGRWQPLVKKAKEAADMIRRFLSAYETEKARKAQAEAARLAAEAAKNAPPKQDNAEAGGAEPQPVAPVTPLMPTTIKGAAGRAATVRVKKVAKVVDYDKAFAALKAVPEVKAAIDKVAQRMIDAGNTIPGVDVEEIRDVA